MTIKEKAGVPYIKKIAEVLSEKIGYKVSSTVTNNSYNSSRDADHRNQGNPDISIDFTSGLDHDDYDRVLLEFGISSMNPCGLSEVAHLSVYDDTMPGVRGHCIDAMNAIIDIFATDDGDIIPFGGGQIYEDRYALAKTLLFAGNGHSNELYEELGFVKVAPYNNTRYEPNTRFLYLFESRKEKKESIRKYGSFPKFAIAKFKPGKNLRRKVNFSDAVIAKYKPETKKPKIKKRLPWEGGENFYMGGFGDHS